MVCTYIIETLSAGSQQQCQVDGGRWRVDSGYVAQEGCVCVASDKLSNCPLSRCEQQINTILPL
jgi:hypothetical protein